jgi:hypothetical protein
MPRQRWKPAIGRALLVTAALMGPIVAQREVLAADPPAPTNVDPELAAEAPVPAWTLEGGGAGGHASGDPRVLNHKIRRAGVVTIFGASVAILGASAAAAGGVMSYMGSSKRLEAVKKEHGYVLPIDDPQRQRIIASAHAAPYVLYTGLGVLVTGIVTTVIARVRLKKLREQRRTSSVAFGAMPTRGGAAMLWEVKF